MFASSEHLADAVKDGKFDIETFVVPSFCTACDLQTVRRRSTGPEPHALMKAEMQSIERPSPKSRIASASGSPKRISFYDLGFDWGRTATANIKNVFCCPNWCMLHQLHLVVKVVLQRFDVWEHAEHHPLRYVNSVATLVNMWRSYGVGETVRKTSESIFGATAASLLSKAPDSTLRGRWNRKDSIESLLVCSLTVHPVRADLILE